MFELIQFVMTWNGRLFHRAALIILGQNGACGNEASLGVFLDLME